MKLKNIVIVVKDERSKQFYKELFGLDVILDQEGECNPDRRSGFAGI